MGRIGTLLLLVRDLSIDWERAAESGSLGRHMEGEPESGGRACPAARLRSGVRCLRSMPIWAATAAPLTSSTGDRSRPLRGPLVREHRPLAGSQPIRRSPLEIRLAPL